MLKMLFGVDAGDCVPRDASGTPKNCLVGRWRTQSDLFPSVGELESWAKVAWRLEGGV